MVEEQRDMIAEATAAAEALKVEREKLEALHKTMQETASRSILGGRTSAGEIQKPPITAEEQYMQEVKSYFKGSAIEKVL